MKYNFKFKPYEHQLKALEKSCYQKYFAYFMDMGTGKSKVLIDNISILYDEKLIGSAFIIAPKGVYRNWEQKEIPTHLPDHIQSHLVVWSPSQSAKYLKQFKSLLEPMDKLKIFLMNVEALSTKKGLAAAQKFLLANKSLLAVDESTTIKSRTATRTKNLIKLAAHTEYRRILTGSPVTKSPLDLFTQCEFLNTKCLRHSSFWTFQNRYAKIIRRSVGSHSFNQIIGYQNLDELNSIISDFSFRVKKEECLDLPDKVYTKRTVELTAEQNTLYQQLKSSALAFISNSENEGMISTSTVLTQILRLQQICSGFAKLDTGEEVKVPTNKLPELMSLLEETNGKVIIWANFTNDILSIQKEISKKYGKESVELFYGGTPAEERQSIVSSFQDPDNPLRFFVGQPRTGGYGLTLTQAKTVVYYSNGYDLEVRLQSEDRAHRIGQENKVTYVDIVVEKTVDEKIIKALRDKINISTQVLAEGYKEWII